MIVTQMSKPMSVYLYTHVILWFLLYLIMTCLSTSSYAQESNEYQLKAAFLYGLIKMVEWPGADAQTTDPLILCFYGEDVFGNALDTIKDKKVKRRSLSLEIGVPLTKIKQCQVLFINKAELNQVARILNIIKNQPVLTISEVESFTNRGGMVNLLKQDDNIKMEINLCEVKRVNLTISSRVLALAKITCQ